MRKPKIRGGCIRIKNGYECQPPKLKGKGDRMRWALGKVRIQLFSFRQIILVYTQINLLLQEINYVYDSHVKNYDYTS